MGTKRNTKAPRWIRAPWPAALGVLVSAALSACGGRSAPGEQPGWDGGVVRPDATVPCLPTTCDGCCTPLGDCVSGTEDMACGLNGAQCANCAVLDGRCQAGRCVDTKPCGPESCSGCCTEDGDCVAGVRPEACGRGGETCRDCGDEVCSMGRCVAGCRDEDGDGYGPGCAPGPDCDDHAPGVVGPCQEHGCPEGWAYVPAGSFVMGCVDTEAVSGCPPEDTEPEAWGSIPPEHEAQTGAYCIQETEVSVRQYRACEAAGWCEPLQPSWLPENRQSRTECNWSEDGTGDRPDHPINCLPFRAMERFCRAWMGGDLPTDEEWEKAARGTDGRPYPWGWQPVPDSRTDEVCRLANLHWCGKEGNRGHWPGDPGPATWEVGHLGDDWASPYGLADTLGNVAEVTRTLFEDPTATVTASATDMTLVPGRGWLFVGGTPDDDYPNGMGTTTYSRIEVLLSDTSPRVGFRCVRAVHALDRGSQAATEQPENEDDSQKR